MFSTFLARAECMQIFKRLKQHVGWFCITQLSTIVTHEMSRLFLLPTEIAMQVQKVT